MEKVFLIVLFKIILYNIECQAELTLILAQVLPHFHLINYSN